ncbi:MAG: sialate O-acetylesterase [Chitinophagaceae bacterium]
MTTSLVKKSFLFVFLIVMGFTSFSQVRLPKLVSDGMVLQRDANVRVWGWASPGEKIAVKFLNKTYGVRAGTDSTWTVILPKLKAGGPYEMQIRGKNAIAIHDILIGEVWLCSGQSNMEYQLMYDGAIYGREMETVNNPQIRQFKVPIRPALDGPKKEMSGGAWKKANPKEIGAFTAVGYFFAKHLYEHYKVPIGFINSSVGGTPIEAWTSEEGLKNFPDILKTVEKNKDTSYINSMRRPGNGFPGQQPASTNDKGTNGPVNWYDPTYIPKGWRNITVPGYWEDQGVKDLNGVMWYRKEIDLPASMVGKPAMVYLGRMVDADILYINGKQVGRTFSLYSERRYSIPPDLLKAGKNLFVSKITNNNGKGGFVPDKPYYIFSGADTVSLTGNWQYKVGEVYQPRTENSSGGFVAAQNSPAALYNGMIAPVINYTIKGFLWYQGESNVSRAAAYADLQPAQINDWRKKWNTGSLPFLFVQLPNYQDYTYLPVESNWALFRESQFKALSLPNTGMAVTIDIGEWNDVHPWNKYDVGKRLALLAEKTVYGEDVVASGPLFNSAMVEGNKIIISFTSIGSGLITSDGEDLGEFAIAGADKKFVWAKAIIQGDKILVTSNEVPNPLYVRYAWSDNPPHPNLYNKEGLPASPFRTDHF